MRRSSGKRESRQAEPLSRLISPRSRRQRPLASKRRVTMLVPNRLVDSHSGRSFHADMDGLESRRVYVIGPSPQSHWLSGNRSKVALACRKPTATRPDLGTVECPASRSRVLAGLVGRCS